MTKELKNNIIRSDRAYRLYLKNRTFYNALKIYNANLVIYELLNNYIKEEDSAEQLEKIISYIFHLEDWFLLFDTNAEKIENAKDQFVFESFEDSIPFPEYFKLNRL